MKAFANMLIPSIPYILKGLPQLPMKLHLVNPAYLIGRYTITLTYPHVYIPLGPGEESNRGGCEGLPAQPRLLFPPFGGILIITTVRATHNRYHPHIIALILVGVVGTHNTPTSFLLYSEDFTGG